MWFLILLLILVLVAICAFVSWFIKYRKSGRCPLCALEKMGVPTKITIDTEKEEDYNSGAALTPPMGWSSWNTFKQNISEELILSTAAAMRLSGLLDAGYKYINIDDCWHSSFRDENGRLQGDLGKFPSGIPSLIEKINHMGMKVGLYSSNGTLTCEDLPASLGNEAVDAKTIAEWGCEFFKYDFCHNKKISGDAPVIEGIELNRPGQAVEYTLKPDDAKFTGRTCVVNIGRLPSGKAIGLLNHNAGTATFKPVIEISGEYVLTLLIYKSLNLHHEQYLQVVVNGEIYEVFAPKTKGFNPTGRLQLIVKLNAGENEIVLRNPVRTLADSSYVQYSRMARELKKATKAVAEKTGNPEKPIVFSICEWGTALPWHWGAKVGNLWRTTHDIMPFWKSIYMIYLRNIGLYKYSKPGAWNDPDMLEVGNGKLTVDENKAHFSLWCMMAAPLVLGNDIRQFVNDDGTAIEDHPVLNIVTNRELIAIDQDPLGKAAKRFKKLQGIDIIARPLANGDTALCFFNTTGKSKGLSFNINDLASDEYLDFGETRSSYSVHELWSDERFSANIISASMPKHGVKVYRISK